MTGLDEHPATDRRRHTPRTDVVLDDPRLAEVRDRLGRSRVKETVVSTLARCRTGELAPEEVCDAVLASLPQAATSLRPVVNATGVVVHTNLGRAPLSAAAVAALQIAAGATDVELDLTDRRRGRQGAGAQKITSDQVHFSNLLNQIIYWVQR